ncbi:MAG: GNAT family N-acetyltransferase [Micromonosporaceae bacterium]|nr:GNAT family N-acetyltransferase [Micromonosporaceae bacterium]
MPTGPVDGDRVRLRRHAEADVDDLAAACADPLIVRFLPHLPHPYTRDDARWWIQEGAPAQWTAGGAAHAIVDPATDRLLGAVGLGRTGLGPGGVPLGEVGYWVAPWARGRGVATAAANTLAAWAFGHGYQRLELLTDLENLASQRVAVAAGFQREGVRRGVARGRDGSPSDRIVWARLADDPPGPSPRLLPDLPDGQLSDGVVTLRPLRTEDTDVMYALHTLPDVTVRSVRPVSPSRAEIQRRCAHSGARWLAGERADMAIMDIASGEIAGEIGLYYHGQATGQAMIGYSVLPQWRGKGYATRATRLVVRWAFDQVEIARLISGTAPDNLGSQKVLARAGFRREGYQRARLPGPNGTRVDDILYARLRTEPA